MTYSYMGVHCEHTYKSERADAQSKFGLCPECEARIVGNLVTLTGSEKQITWAEDIRRKAIESIVEAVSRRLSHDLSKVTGQLIDVIRKLAQIESATWWIDNRFLDVNGLLKAGKEL